MQNELKKVSIIRMRVNKIKMNRWMKTKFIPVISCFNQLDNQSRNLLMNKKEKPQKCNSNQ